MVDPNEAPEGYYAEGYDIEYLGCIGCVFEMDEQGECGTCSAKLREDGEDVIYKKI